MLACQTYRRKRRILQNMIIGADYLPNYAVTGISQVSTIGTLKSVNDRIRNNTLKAQKQQIRIL